MLNIEIKTIPDGEQRYNTVGDYWKEGNKDVFRVSDMGDWKYEILVAIHEITEETLCRARGVNDDDITNFDEQYEVGRKYGALDEPGNDPRAPYYKEHQFANKIERLLADELGVDWGEYCKITARLDNLTLENKSK